MSEEKEIKWKKISEMTLQERKDLYKLLFPDDYENKYGNREDREVINKRCFYLIVRMIE